MCLYVNCCNGVVSLFVMCYWCLCGQGESSWPWREPAAGKVGKLVATAVAATTDALQWPAMEMTATSFIILPVLK